MGHIILFVGSRWHPNIQHIQICSAKIKVKSRCLRIRKFEELENEMKIMKARIHCWIWTKSYSCDILQYRRQLEAFVNKTWSWCEINGVDKVEGKERTSFVQQIWRLSLRKYINIRWKKPLEIETRKSISSLYCRDQGTHLDSIYFFGTQENKFNRSDILQFWPKDIDILTQYIVDFARCFNHESSSHSRSVILSERYICVSMCPVVN